jgi:two-component system chemotaxis response regulator CheB
MFNKNDIKAIVIGGSAGSLQVLNTILPQLPEKSRVPIFIAVHRLKHVYSGMTESLNIKSKLKIVEPTDKQAIVSGLIYLAPANYHLGIERSGIFSVGTDELVLGSRPSIDITLGACAEFYKKNLLGILLTGANKDGGDGMRKIHDNGGYTVVQDPKTCMIDTMPKAALAATQVDEILSVEQITNLLKNTIQ